MSDHLIRSVAKEAGVRAVLAVITNTANEGARRHGSTPTATMALARALTVGTLAGSMLKVRQRISLKFEGNGPLKKLIAESDAYGRVRAFVEEPKVEVERDDFGRIDVPAALGTGQLFVVKDVNLKELIESVTNLTTSEIGDDFASFLNLSEQIPSIVRLVTKLDEDGNVLLAAGLMLQQFGDPDHDVIAELEGRLGKLPPLEEMLESASEPASVISRILEEHDHRILETRDVNFVCSCSVDNSEKAIAMLGREDIEALIAEGSASVSCHFCHEEFLFSAEDLAYILKTLD